MATKFPLDFFMNSLPAPLLLSESGFVLNGDSTNLLKMFPPESVDLILTDPPYGIDYSPKRRGKIRNDTPKRATQLFHQLVLEASRILKPGGCCITFCFSGGKPTLFPQWVTEMERILDYKATLVWDKCVTGRGAHYRHQFEFILVAKKLGAPCVWNGDGTQSRLIRVLKKFPDESDHPTPKPVKLLSHLIALHSKRGQIVLDPFAGHGSTLLAAQQLGRKFIGVELDRSFSAKIVRNLRQS